MNIDNLPSFAQMILKRQPERDRINSNSPNPNKKQSMKNSDLIDSKILKNE